MNRQQMIDALAKLGFDVHRITAETPDGVLAEMLRVYENQDSAAAAKQQAQATGSGDSPDKSAEKPQEGAMSHDEMIEALVGMGYDKAELDGKSDEELQSLLETEQSAAEPEGDEAGGEMPPEGGEMPPEGEEVPAEQMPAEGEAPSDADGSLPDEQEGAPMEGNPGDTEPAPTRDEMIEALVETGYDRSELDGMNDEELSDVFNQELQAHIEQLAEEEAMDQEDAPAPQGAEEQQMQRMSERAELLDAVRAVIDEKLSEFQSVRNELANVQRTVRQLQVNSKRANVIAFCEAERAAGKIVPAKFDETVARLMRADASKVVRRFGEKGQKVLTELDLQMKEIRDAQPFVQFGEHMRQKSKPLGTEIDKVKQHFRQFSEQYARTGTTMAEFVQAFKHARVRKNGKLTAEQFITPNA